jgi:hypothetical protein
MGFFSKDIKTMDDLFVHTLRGIDYAEQRILQALPTMIEKATNPQLVGFRTSSCRNAQPPAPGRARVRNAWHRT